MLQRGTLTLIFGGARGLKQRAIIFMDTSFSTQCVRMPRSAQPPFFRNGAGRASLVLVQLVMAVGRKPVSTTNKNYNFREGDLGGE